MKPATRISRCTCGRGSDRSPGVESAQNERLGTSRPAKLRLRALAFYENAKSEAWLAAILSRLASYNGKFMMIWQLAEAKNRLSEVVNRALEEGPQRITRRGDAVVLMSESQYQQVMGERQSFAQYLCSAPSLDGLDLQRRPCVMGCMS